MIITGNYYKTDRYCQLSMYWR